jgi:membrane fusion protein, heavy metal efflux system
MMTKKTTRTALALGTILLAGVLGGCPSGDDHQEPGTETEHDEHGDEGGDEGGHDEHGDEGGQDEHGEEGEEGVVHLTPEQIERAGIRMHKAGRGPITVSLQLDAVVAENEDTQSHVNPRASGLVRKIHKRLGETVETGDVLCEIDSVELGEAVSLHRAARSTASAAQALLTREGELFAQRVQTTTKVLDGAIALARRIRDREKELESEGISTLRPLLEAEKALQEAELGKGQALAELTAERDSRLLELESAASTTAIAKLAAEDRLRILGVDPASAATQKESPVGSLGLYAVKAPRPGVIVARDVTPDEFVGPETTLFEIHDPSVSWIVASVYERDLRLVRRGQAVRVTVGALPGAVFEGRVGFIEYEVSSTTRTARLRIEIPNQPVEQWAEPFPLRPGMFASVEVVTASGDVALSLPESAIVHEGAASFVFVRSAPGEFERREVTIGAKGSTSVEIVSGVKPGEDVAIEGTFILKSAARAGELGEGHSH